MQTEHSSVIISDEKSQTLWKKINPVSLKQCILHSIMTWGIWLPESYFWVKSKQFTCIKLIRTSHHDHTIWARTGRMERKKGRARPIGQWKDMYFARKRFQAQGLASSVKSRAEKEPYLRPWHELQVQVNIPGNGRPIVCLCGGTNWCCHWQPYPLEHTGRQVPPSASSNFMAHSFKCIIIHF